MAALVTFNDLEADHSGVNMLLKHQGGWAISAHVCIHPEGNFNLCWSVITMVRGDVRTPPVALLARHDNAVADDPRAHSLTHAFTGSLNGSTAQSLDHSLARLLDCRAVPCSRV